MWLVVRSWLEPIDYYKQLKLLLLFRINKHDEACFRIHFEKSTWLADAVRAWKPASVHEIRMTLNRVAFSTSQIKVYWKPKWEGEVAMATSMKRASDLTRNQSINVWFPSCLIKKVCTWLIANFWEYRRRRWGFFIAAFRLKDSCGVSPLTKPNKGRLNLWGEREKLLWNEKKRRVGGGGGGHLKTLVVLQMIYCESNPIQDLKSDNNATARNPKSITLNCFLKYWPLFFFFFFFLAWPI